MAIGEILFIRILFGFVYYIIRFILIYIYSLYVYNIYSYLDLRIIILNLFVGGFGLKFE